MSGAVVAERAECRGCHQALDGKPYYMGGRAYHPVTREQAKVNFYGGFVCSSACDHRASLELERTMPGHSPGKNLISSLARASLERNWL